MLLKEIKNVSLLMTSAVVVFSEMQEDSPGPHSSCPVFQQVYLRDASCFFIADQDRCEQGNAGRYVQYQ